MTTPFPPQTSNRLRFRCTATGYSVSTRLCKNGYVTIEYFIFELGYSNSEKSVKMRTKQQASTHVVKST